MGAERVVGSRADYGLEIIAVLVVLLAHRYRHPPGGILLAPYDLGYALRRPPADLADALAGTVAQLGRTIRTLTDERNRSAAILGSMIEGVAVVGSDERILYCNAAFEQILELPEGSSKGKKLVEALRQAELVTLVRQVLPGGEEITGEVEVGTVRPRSFSSSEVGYSSVASVARPSWTSPRQSASWSSGNFSDG